MTDHFDPGGVHDYDGVTVLEKQTPSGTIRYFDDEVLQADVTEAFKRIPEGHRFAVIPHLDLEGPRMTAVMKVGDTFSLAISARHSWTGWKGDWKSRGAIGLDVLFSPF